MGMPAHAMPVYGIGGMNRTMRTRPAADRNHWRSALALVAYGGNGQRYVSTNVTVGDH
jgi:hypothetical protein